MLIDIITLIYFKLLRGKSMIIREYPVFQTVDDAKKFCQNHSRKEKRELLLNYFGRRKSMLSQFQMWAAPSIYHLQYLLSGLYDLGEAFSRYDELSLLEKHGTAHIVVSLTAPYVEGQTAVMIAESKAAPPKYIVYMSTKIFNDKDKQYRNIYIFNPTTCNKVTRKIEKNFEVLNLKQQIQKWTDHDDIRVYENTYLTFDTENIDYFGNYIHQKIKNKMAHIAEWNQIKIIRNRLAHPHEGISEKDLKRVCEILCSKEFVEDIEALVFFLSPLSDEDKHLFCKEGYHNNTNRVCKIANVMCQVNTK